MIAIIIGAKNGREMLARSRMNCTQKRAFALVAVPAAFNGHNVAVGQRESRDIERVGVAVFGKPSTGNVVDRAAGVGRRHFHFRNRTAKVETARPARQPPRPSDQLSAPLGNAAVRQGASKPVHPLPPTWRRDAPCRKHLGRRARNEAARMYWCAQRPRSGMRVLPTRARALLSQQNSGYWSRSPTASRGSQATRRREAERH